jgi:hypothetical protein
MELLVEPKGLLVLPVIKRCVDIRLYIPELINIFSPTALDRELSRQSLKSDANEGNFP